MGLYIGVDCDDVLSETIAAMLKRPPLNEKGIKVSDISSYNLFEVEKIGISREEAIAAFYSFFESPEYYLTQAVSGAYEKLVGWKQQGHKLFVVTGRPERYEQVTRDWIEKHFPGIFSGYLFMNQYCDNEIPKSVLCKKKGIQLLIDDSAQNIRDMNSVGMPGFLFDRQRNKGVEDTSLLKRVYSRDEINLNEFFEL